MANIRVAPDKLRSGAKKIETNLKEYEATYKKLVDLIRRNEAGFDQATQSAMLETLGRMEKKFKDMSSYMTKVVTVVKNVADEYDKANEAAGKSIGSITI